MKFRSRLSLLIAFLFACNFNLWAAQPGQTEASDGQVVLDPDSESEFNRLSTQAADEGVVQVMVVLKESDDLLTKGKGPVSQEKRIEAMQDAVLNDMPKKRKNRTVKRLRNLPLVAIAADLAELKQLHNSPHVAEIVEDKMNFPLALNASIARIGGDAGWALGHTGAEQSVAILDNGVDKNHPYLAGRVVQEACFSTKNQKQKVSSGCRGKKTKDTKPGAASVTCALKDYSCTHGTLLAGLAAANSGTPNLAGSGAAPSASIIAVKVNSLIKNKKVCGSNTACSVFFDSDLLRGLEYVYSLRNSLKIAAVNVSIGGNSTAKQCKRSPIKRTVSKLKAAGIATVAASGNDGSASKLSAPACVAGVVAVGATNDADAVADFSNSSKQLSLLAPGVNIGFIMPGVTERPGEDLLAKGTSISAALVTGAWAALKSHKPNDSVDQILQALTSTGVPLTDPKSGNTTPRIQINRAHAALP